MKKLLGGILLTGTLICAGCVTTSPADSVRATSATPLSAAKIAPPPPVTPDEVTTANAHQVARKLEAEMDRDTKEP